MIEPEYVLIKITNGKELLLEPKDITYKNKKILIFDKNIFENP